MSQREARNYIDRLQNFRDVWQHIINPHNLSIINKHTRVYNKLWEEGMFAPEFANELKTQNWGDVNCRYGAISVYGFFAEVVGLVIITFHELDYWVSLNHGSKSEETGGTDLTIGASWWSRSYPIQVKAGGMYPIRPKSHWYDSRYSGVDRLAIVDTNRYQLLLITDYTKFKKLFPFEQGLEIDPQFILDHGHKHWDRSPKLYKLL